MHSPSTSDERPDPDALLDQLQREEAKQKRGKLKIFFGACAGVGKTYAMLQAAQVRARAGADVVIGVVVTHGRQETLALLGKLEILPMRRIAYRGHVLEEFDLDGALARKPTLLLIDELAHANAPGARHAKRWQDVEDILEAGIDVYSTLNVQHLESLNDIVGQITGIEVRERVPDHVFQGADEVTLVDLPVDELLERLRVGKVYMQKQAEHAARNFFRKGNLIALRELALRRTADRVDEQMRVYRADRAITPVWQAHERLLVCIGPGPESIALVRAAGRLAHSLKADWVAVHVETPTLQRRSIAQRECTLSALKMAQELGAETLTLEGAQRSGEVASLLMHYAQVRNVSKLVMGASHNKKRAWYTFRSSLADTLITQASSIDIILIAADTLHARLQDEAREASPNITQPEELLQDRQPNQTQPRDQASTQSLSSATKNTQKQDSDARESASNLIFSGHASTYRKVRSYIEVLAVCGFTTLLIGVLFKPFDLTNKVMLYLLGVVWLATRLGRWPAVLASFLNVAAFDFFFVPPHASWSAAGTQYVLTFVGMLVTALVISHFTSSLRQQALRAIYRERRTSAMYAMAGELGSALTVEQIVETGSRHVHEIFRAQVAILLPDSHDHIQQKTLDPSPGLVLPDTLLDLGIAQWVYDQQKPAGAGTNTLSAAAALYMPLRAPMRTRGVLALIMQDSRLLALPEQGHLLDAFTSQIALALERVHYLEIAQDALIKIETERLLKKT